MRKYLYINILTATGNFYGESFSHPPLKIIFRCSCSEKPIFIGLASLRAGFAGHCPQVSENRLHLLRQFGLSGALEGVFAPAA
ncbi:MAG: hypothetical protein J6X82_05705 [Bacteroidales bacterium]|nr:hypothetical protein [Bacteroidales bacterium]